MKMKLLKSDFKNDNKSILLLVYSYLGFQL